MERFGELTGDEATHAEGTAEKLRGKAVRTGHDRVHARANARPTGWTLRPAQVRRDS
jgi:uncharacterized protein YjbJ (UPF0337 family)